MIQLLVIPMQFCSKKDSIMFFDAKWKMLRMLNLPF